MEIENWYGKCFSIFSGYFHVRLPSNFAGETGMRSFLINKNLSFYYWLKKRIGKKRAYRVAIVFEKVILIFGREHMREMERGRL
jgi:hypothetical protein